MVAIILGSNFYPSFLAPKKEQKGTAQTKSVVTAFAREFSETKISLGRLLLAGNFPLIVAGCASLAAPMARQKTCTSSPRLSAAVACDFDSAVVI